MVHQSLPVQNGIIRLEQYLLLFTHNYDAHMRMSNVYLLVWDMKFMNGTLFLQQHICVGS